MTRKRARRIERRRERGPLKLTPIYDREKYGPAISVEPVFVGKTSTGRKPNPQAYPKGCRQLFRVHKIKPHEARKGKRPAGV